MKRCKRIGESPRAFCTGGIRCHPAKHWDDQTHIAWSCNWELLREKGKAYSLCLSRDLHAQFPGLSSPALLNLHRVLWPSEAARTCHKNPRCTEKGTCNMHYDQAMDIHQMGKCHLLNVHGTSVSNHWPYPVKMGPIKSLSPYFFYSFYIVNITVSSASLSKLQ